MQSYDPEVEQFCRTHLPSDIRRKVALNQPLERDDYVRWMKILNDKGWLVAHWPAEYGGLGWSRLKRWQFENSIYRAGCPWLVPFGITYVAPVIYTFGNEAQKRRWLPGTASCDILWCQGYSEPGAGSDLAGLQTRAVRDGDHYVVTGQKIWTTMAGWADMMFALVRTDPDTKQRGISFLLIDMKSPNLTLRPIRSIDGGEELFEVFFDGVRVPVDNLIGEEGGGWTFAKFILDNERLLAAELGKAHRMLDQLANFMERVTVDGRPLSERAHWHRRLADLDARAIGLECLCHELFAEVGETGQAGPIASMLKVVGSELLQDIGGALVDVLAEGGFSPQPESTSVGGVFPTGMPRSAPGAVGEYLYGRVYSIYGGSNEIQRNIIAKAVLGL